MAQPKDELDELLKPTSDELDEVERERRAMAYLDEHLGPGDEKAYAAILRIAKGEVSAEHLDSTGKPTTKRPSYAQQLAAWDMLMNRHRGRPVAKVTVEDKRKPAAQKWDPDALELEELRELKRLAEKAQTPAIEGEFTVDPEDKDP